MYLVDHWPKWRTRNLPVLGGSVSIDNMKISVILSRFYSFIFFDNAIQVDGFI